MKFSFPKSEIALLERLLAHAIRSKPSIVPITLLGVFSSICELCAVTSIIPLSLLASGARLAAHSVWNRLPNLIGVPANEKFFMALFLGLLLLRMVTYMTTQILNAYIMQSLLAYFSARAHASFVRHLSFVEILKHQIGHFVTLAGDEASRGAQIVSGAMKLVPIAFLFAAYTAVTFYQSRSLGLGLFVLLLMMVASLRGAFKKSLVLGKSQQEEGRDSNTHFFESLGGLRTVRGFTAEDFVVSRYTMLINKYTFTTFLSEALSQIAQLPAIIVIGVMFGVTLVYADNSWLIQNMPLILAGIMMFTRLLPTANQGLEAALKLTANLKAGQNVDEMLQAVQFAEEIGSLPPFTADEQITRIEFNNVSFQYTAESPPVLRNFNCTLRAGSSYAVEGPSGVGKSSLVDLLLKFYEPDKGAIHVNGQNIAQVSADSLRQHIVLAEQTTRIFHGTVLENVQFGHSHINAEAHAALGVVGLKDFLDSLPAGPDTILGFQGSNFSGGQRQRVGIARALARKADVLILDESTNALDHATRERILDTLLADYHDRILIFVTHDPYVIGRVTEVIRLQPAGALQRSASATAAG